ncbi:MAG TPA: methyltransferase domain-containing protein [Caulobacteraceae bacterium]|nr:methyltransferase domain-containing protein [Caulobacteraceae bacterium]
MDVLEAAGPNAGQIAYWNETAGPNWVAMQPALDREIEPLGLEAMRALAPAEGETLVDLGCGCGATTLELARRVGAGGSVLGADLSAPMLAVARARAAAAGLGQARFVQADAQVHPFAPADGAFSRFGVMFFADPAAAFANVRRALEPGGRLAFVCWRALAENPWMTVPMAAARPLLPGPPPPAPDPAAPGPFAFADRDRLADILARAGFADVRIEPHDRSVGWGDLDSSTDTVLRVGPLGAAVREHPQLKPAIAAAVRAALEPHLGADGVLLGSATWIVLAR